MGSDYILARYLYYKMSPRRKEIRFLAPISTSWWN